MKKKTILISGSTGQLGQELATIVAQFENADCIFLNREALDLSKASSIKACFEKYNPDYFINCAAYTAVDKAESDQEQASQINAKAPGLIAELCHKMGAKLIHISTDYVFDGNGKTPYKTNHKVDPINFYGASKAEGEQLVMANNDDSVIIRTAWVYSEFGKNFVKTMLELMDSKPELNVVNDQIGAPTYAKDLAKAIVKICNSENFVPGIYHYSNEGEISWFDFATAIAQLSGSNCQVHPIPSSAFPTPAKRPAYSLLDTHSIQDTYKVEIPYWVNSLKECLIALQKTN